jgi:hypothetical protein
VSDYARDEVMGQEAQTRWGVKKAEPQVTLSDARLLRGWFIPAHFVNFPEESVALSSFR